MLTHVEHVMPAFDDAVHQSQSTFRRALAALSEPGTVQELGFERSVGGLTPAGYALCLTLLDEHSPVWIDPAFDQQALHRTLTFHCGCPVVDKAADAGFALLDGNALPDLTAFAVGTDRDPHLACTLFIQLEQLDGGPLTYWQGPGIAHRVSMQLPVPAAFWQQRQQLQFPRGLDIFFLAGNQLVGLPRSTRVLHSVQEGR